MRKTIRLSLLLLFASILFVLATSNAPTRVTAQSNSHDPTWWDKYQFLRNSGADGFAGTGASLAVGSNVDVSNECGPQSETFITINPNRTKVLAAGSNEIFRLPMRGYFSSNAGASWGGVDLPLPPSKSKSGFDFGSDPTLAFDSGDNLFYGYIVVDFSGVNSVNGNGINGTAMAVARSTDGGKTYPTVAFFAFQSGENHFNDKPMITADTNLASPFRDYIYIAWDAASGGSATGGGVLVGTSVDHGATFTIARADDPSGPGKSIGASPAVGPTGEVYVAWNDYKANAIVFNRSFDGGQTWGQPVTISTKVIPFDIGIPAESFRRALVYPSLDVDRSGGMHRGRIYCTWMDLTSANTTDIFVSYSDNKGVTWSPPAPVTDHLSAVDRFNHWMSVDPITGDVNVAFYDTRNDTTGSRYQTDYYLAQSQDGGVTWNAPDVRVSTASSNEHDCNGVFPCQGINYGNQQGDYEGLVSFAGVSYPIWTDSRRQLDPASGCRRPYLMEEVFTAKVK